MSTVMIRAAAILAVALPLAGCFAYTEAPAPTPVIVTAPATTTGPVVVRPAY